MPPFSYKCIKRGDEVCKAKTPPFLRSWVLPKESPRIPSHQKRQCDRSIRAVVWRKGLWSEREASTLFTTYLSGIGEIWNKFHNSEIYLLTLATGRNRSIESFLETFRVCSGPALDGVCFIISLPLDRTWSALRSNSSRLQNGVISFNFLIQLSKFRIFKSLQTNWLWKRLLHIGFRIP